MCNEAAFRDEEDDEEEDFQIPLCHELGSFIFRRSGIAPFEPTFSIGILDYTIKDSLAVYALPISRVREDLKCSLQEYLCDETFIDAYVDQDLDVKVGFITGRGCRDDGHDRWYSAYLYCRRFVEDSDPSHKDWAWRVVVFQAHGENPTTLYGRKPRFDSIPEFLEWYSSWLEHIDLDQVRKDVQGYWYESDEDP